MTQRQSQVKVLSIHKFAQLCRTTPRTLRFYDKQGLLKPIKVDSSTQYRYYSPEQARKFFKIKLLQTFQIPLKDMKKVLRNKSEGEYLEEKLDHIDNEIQEKKKEYLFLKEIKNILFGGGMKQFSRTETHGPFTLFCMHIPDGQFDEINFNIYKLKELATTLKISTQDQQVVTYLDPPDKYKPKNARLEIGLVCKNLKIPRRNLPENIYFKVFPKQKTLTYTYRGPFKYLTFVHQKLYELVSSKKIKRNPFDIHSKGPWNTKSEYDFLTKVGYGL